MSWHVISVLLAVRYHSAGQGSSGRRRWPVPADYREQLVVAGIIQPAPDLATPDPATQV